MSPFAIATLAVGMSIDAFVASLSRGAGMGRPPLLQAVKTGLVFGTVEAITPVIGWLAGIAASRHIEVIDHWIAFVLLAGVGGRMVMQGLADTADEPSPDSRSPAILMITAVGTSIDAMAVGVSLAVLQVNILAVALATGVATFTMSTGGMLLSRLIGPGLGKRAEIAGGIGLAGLGVMILLEHLTD